MTARTNKRAVALTQHNRGFKGTGDMTDRLKMGLMLTAAAACALMSVRAHADTTEPPDGVWSPTKEGAYVAVLPMYMKAFQTSFGTNSSEQSQIRRGYGGDIAFGYRKYFYALEIAGTYQYDKGPSELGIVAQGLFFPFKEHAPGLFGSIGFGLSEIRGYGNLNGYATPGVAFAGANSFSITGWNAGIGDLIPLHIGNFKFAIRAEARYRYAERRLQLNQSNVDFDAPRFFNQASVRVGLQIPLGWSFNSTTLPESPTKVVPVDEKTPNQGSAAGQPPPAPAGDQAAPQGPAGDATGAPPPPPPTTDSSGLDSILNGGGPSPAPTRPSTDGGKK